MSDISKIDKNFTVQSELGKEDLVFHPTPSEKFAVYGVYVENGQYRRLPEEIAKTVSEGVYELHAHTAGGRVRFKTDSPYVAIYAKMPVIYRMAHFAMCGSSGFDIYADGEFVKSFLPPVNMKDGYKSIYDFGSKQMRDITINMPLYSQVSELYIGLAADAEIEKADKYKIEKPIVFYGSSITQGGCASRPGTAYTSIVARHFDADHVNLGFSGNAKGEDEIADYIKGLDMSLFVYDYDFNAPSRDHLAATHERMFLKIREANPDLPILIMSKPRWKLEWGNLVRLDIIRKTYINAMERGDKHVYFIDGRDLMRIAQNDGTVDGTHPTDLGFFSMASEVIRVIERDEIFK